MHVEVRVLTDCGELMTDLGPVRLEKDTTHFLRRVDVAMHVRRGVLQQTEYKEWKQKYHIPKNTSTNTNPP